MADILVVGTHPDDIELGLGGAIARWVNTGYDVAMLDLTNGEPTPFGDPVTRAKESQAAANVLGVKIRITLDLKNRELEDNLEARRKVAEVYRRLRPELIFMQAEQDSHPDHIEGSKIAWKARFDSKLTKTDMAGEPWFPKKAFLYYATHLDYIPKPSFILDISDTFETKLNATLEYKSQFFDAGKEDWIVNRLKTTFGYFGSIIGVKYGEPVMLKDELGLSDIRDIIR